MLFAKTYSPNFYGHPSGINVLEGLNRAGYFWVVEGNRIFVQHPIKPEDKFTVSIPDSRKPKVFDRLSDNESVD